MVVVLFIVCVHPPSRRRYGVTSRGGVKDAERDDGLLRVEGFF